MRRDEVIGFCLEEEAACRAGEDFSRTEHSGRMETESMAWNYDEIAQERLRAAKSFVDMQNGSSELFGKLRRLPFHAFATQSDPGKIDAMRIGLSSLGFRISAVENPAELPFQDNAFDLVLNRHTPYAADALARVTRPGGVFLTEQADGRDAIEVSQHIEVRRPPHLLGRNLSVAVGELRTAGFTIEDAREGRGEMRFGDIGAVVRYALHNPAYFPGFTVATREDALYSLYRHMQTHGYLRAFARRYLIVARLL